MEKQKKNPSNESLFVSICRFDRVYQRWIIKYHKDGIKKNVKKPDVEFSEANKTTTKTKNEKRKRTHSQMSKKIIDYCQSSNPNQLIMYVSMAIILDITNSGILFSCLKKIKNQTHEIELMVVFSFLVSCKS